MNSKCFYISSQGFMVAEVAKQSYVWEFFTLPYFLFAFVHMLYIQNTSATFLVLFVFD